MTHNDYYVHLLLNTLSKDEHEEEIKRLRNILGAHPKPMRTEQEQRFVDFVHQNIYVGNTAFDILKRHFKINTENATYDYWQEKTGLTKEKLQCKIDAAQRLAKCLIRKGYARFDTKLNELRNDTQ